jgi:hypothetical protein
MLIEQAIVESKANREAERVSTFLSAQHEIKERKAEEKRLNVLAKSTLRGARHMTCRHAQSPQK